MTKSVYIVCDKDCLTAKSTLTPVFGCLQYAKNRPGKSCRALSVIRNWTVVKAGNKAMVERLCVLPT